MICQPTSFSNVVQNLSAEATHDENGTDTVAAPTLSRLLNVAKRVSFDTSFLNRESDGFEHHFGETGCGTPLRTCRRGWFDEEEHWATFEQVHP